MHQFEFELFWTFFARYLPLKYKCISQISFALVLSIWCQHMSRWGLMAPKLATEAGTKFKTVFLSLFNFYLGCFF